VSVAEERVSPRKVLKHWGAVLVPKAAVRSIPPSKKSGGTTVLPTPSVASEVSQGVVMLPLKALGPEFVVAQSVSVGFGLPRVLQSELVAVAICWRGLLPPTHLYAVMVLTPPPSVNSETTRTSPSVCFPVKVRAGPGDEQLTVPSCRNQK